MGALGPAGHLCCAPLRLYENLAYGEKTNEQGNETYPSLQIGDAEGEALRSRNSIQAHQAEQAAYHGAQQPFHDGVSRYARDYGETHHQERKILRRPEQKTDHRKRICHQDETDVAKGVSESGRIESHVDGAFRFSLEGQGIAVQTGGGAGGRAGCVGQDGRYRPAEERALVNPQEKGKTQHRGHEEGKRNQDGRRHDTGEARDGPHRDARENADRHHAHGLPGEGYRDSFEDRIKHAGTLPKTPFGEANLKAEPEEVIHEQRKKGRHGCHQAQASCPQDTR